MPHPTLKDRDNSVGLRKIERHTFQGGAMVPDGISKSNLIPN